MYWEIVYLAVLKISLIYEVGDCSMIMDARVSP